MKPRSVQRDRPPLPPTADHLHRRAMEPASWPNREVDSLDESRDGPDHLGWRHQDHHHVTADGADHLCPPDPQPVGSASPTPDNTAPQWRTLARWRAESDGGVARVLPGTPSLG